MCFVASANQDASVTGDVSAVPPCPPASGYVMADKMTRDADSGEYLQMAVTSAADNARLDAPTGLRSMYSDKRNFVLVCALFLKL
jgi:hypothetical protein